ncbi:ABC-2 type transport system ATP-binding protein [Granulicatella balaenopterae]|uniref:ABC-2 type transport system ATP-binding protein n=1 Tax=Granulicatella balaenopterae TaxID=137733 RepID=A0A1H9IYU9_9LACT|nr:ABC-2 type transport system ATP-binding protein [Granulicatella balaenopterae]
MIEFKQVTKKYDEKIALNNLDLTIEKGEILGLIGHNGAGKSTTIKILVNIINQTSGEVLIDGKNIHDDLVWSKKQIGYVADSPDLFLRLTAQEYWDFVACAYELSEKDKNAQLTPLIELFDLTDYRYDIIDSFSHGMRQKVFIIGALLSNPNIWVLDEPMTGLDPQSSYDLKEMMKQHAKEGNIVIFSTHVLQVAEQLCDKIAILKKGELIYHGTLEELKEQTPEESLEDIYLQMAGREKVAKAKVEAVKVETQADGETVVEEVEVITEIDHQVEESHCCGCCSHEQAEDETKSEEANEKPSLTDTNRESEASHHPTNSETVGEHDEK